jgi:hypothetical protein
LTAESLPRSASNSAASPCCAYTIDAANELVSVKFAHKITFRDIAAYASKLRANPQFVPSFCEIIDLRDVEQVEVSATEGMTLADHVDPFTASSKRAFVCRSNAQINVAHIHRILRAESATIRIFLSLDEANQWIAG